MDWGVKEFLQKKEGDNEKKMYIFTIGKEANKVHIRLGV